MWLQPATLLKVTLMHECFSRFLNCTNGTKSRKASHMIEKNTESERKIYSGIERNFCAIIISH